MGRRDHRDSPPAKRRRYSRSRSPSRTRSSRREKPPTKSAQPAAPAAPAPAAAPTAAAGGGIVMSGVPIPDHIPAEHRGAYAFEMNIHNYHLSLQSGQALECFRNNLKLGITPSVRIYCMLLACCALNFDKGGVEEVLRDFHQRNLVLEVEQYESIISILGLSPYKHLAYPVFKELLKNRGKINNPRTFHIICDSVTQPLEVAEVVNGMAKLRLSMTAPMAATLLLVTGKHPPGTERETLINHISRYKVKFTCIKDSFDPLQLRAFIRILSESKLCIERELYTTAVSKLINSHVWSVAVELFDVYYGSMAAGITPKSDKEQQERDIQEVGDILEKAGDSNLGVIFWNALMRSGIRPQPAIVKKVMGLLSKNHDDRIGLLYQQCQAWVPHTVELFKLLLEVAAAKGDAAMAKNAWRQMQNYEIFPDESTINLLLRASIDDPGVLGQLRDVMKASELNIPAKSEIYCRIVDASKAQAPAQATAAQFSGTPGSYGQY